MQENKVNLPPEADTVFCPTETNREDVKKLPQPNSGREGQSGQMGLGEANCPGTKKSGSGW